VEYAVVPGVPSQDPGHRQSESGGSCGKAWREFVGGVVPCGGGPVPGGVVAVWCEHGWQWIGRAWM